MSNNQLNDLSKTYLEAVYGGAKKEAPKDDRMVVTAADKKANTKAYQNYKAGNKAYKAADHLKDNYEFARHKASIISRGGRLEDAVESWNQKVAYKESMKSVDEKKVVDVEDTYNTISSIVNNEEYGKNSHSKKVMGYQKGGMVGKKKKHGCASKVKHEEFGIGNPVKGMHDLDENGKVAHYDVLFDHGVEKNVPVSALEIIDEAMHEHVIHDYAEQKKMDPVGQEDDDIDNDGDVDSSDKYLHKRRKAIGKAMGKKVKKESLSDWRTDLSDLIEIVAEPEPEAEKKVKEGKVKNKVTINPKISEAIEEMGGEVLEHSEIEEGTMKNCGCGQNPCITYGEQKEVKRVKKSQVDESEKLAQKAYDRAQKLGAKRRSSSNPRGIGKSERAGYNLAQSQRSRNVDLATQGGPQTGGGPKSFGYAKNKSNPVKSKSIGDTGATGHYKKRDEKVTSKSGKTTRYKMKFKDRMNAPVSRRQELKDPKKNPKHTANTQKEENIFSRLMETKDKKGKGSGTKDACYHKVKSRYSVWPSAYASGALVKCRKVGAANWGNSSKK